MGKRRRGGGAGSGSGGGGGGDDEGGGGGGRGFADQYGEGWSGGHRDDSSRGQGGGKPGRGGGQAGGSSAPQLTYTRQLPKFLQGFGELMAGRVDEEAPLVEDYSGAQRRLGDIGDEEDVLHASRLGLGSKRHGDQHVAAPDGAFAGLDGDSLAAEREAALRVQLANDQKALGNRAFSEGRHEDAVRHFSACIAVDASNHIFWSNRSAAHAALCQWDAARRDAVKTTVLAPDWPKGWARLGSAAMGCQAFTDATEAYTRAIKLDPDNEQYRQSKQAAEEAEAKALAAGRFKFHKVDSAAPASKRSKVAVPSAVAGVRNPTLLSFDAEDDNDDD